jgi:membrane protease YdiL (CAAX protease family)
VLSTALLVFVAVYAASAIVSQYSDPGREQGLTPDHWDSHRAVQFAVNFAVFVAVAPVVEELTFRGLGYSLLEPLGRTAAVLWVGLAFGLAHGLVEGLPILIVFGAGLALLRARTGSVVPGMVVHSAFNAIALVLSVTT